MAAAVAPVFLATVRVVVPGVASVPLVRLSVTPSMASAMVLLDRVMSMPLIVSLASSAAWVCTRLADLRLSRACVPPLPESVTATVIAPAVPLVLELSTSRLVVPSLMMVAVTPASALLMAWRMPVRVLLLLSIVMFFAVPPPMLMESVPSVKVSVVAA